MQYVIIYILL